ncbi:endogenous retrovirus group K member 24 Gag polyproteinpolyprotein-like isoform X1 [Podarcis lilfordi]|uniref:Endogenous retrovirus group K member 24 Gag polyproteinpolyprotein-like isoform X1 n=1 Tax=Podarcis lilfordi TaxID=74358 RepID=A0AA35KFS0_9SAUR|nr:endogenous retrovirus group K member 24 Gag polyproteinpolyprotein-like isoform X1 [Podarcis lilfordi]
MGSSLSTPQQKFLKDLKFLLSSNKLEVPEGDLIQLILAIEEHSPWFPADGTWELKHWDKIGAHFHGHPSIGLRILNAWCKVRYAMGSLSPKNISMAALPTQPPASLVQPAVLASVPILALPAAPDPKPPDYSSSPEDPILQKYRGLAGNDPNLSAAEPATPFQRAVLACSLIQDTMAFPVIVPPAGALAGTQAQHQPFDFKILRELQQSVKANGLQAPYTQALLEATLAQLLVPEDIKLLAHTVLPPSAGVLFAHEWETACRAYAPALLQQVRGNNPNVTLADVIVAMMGRGPFVQASVQATLLQILLRDTALAAKQAMRKIPEPSIQSRWGSIRQEARESYSSFMDRLLTAVSRQIENPEAKQIIIKQLAFENANEDCKVALRPIIHNPATDTAAMLRIYQSVGTATHKAHLLAAALNENQPVATETTCFQCGKPGSPIPQFG